MPIQLTSSITDPRIATPVVAVCCQKTHDCIRKIIGVVKGEHSKRFQVELVTKNEAQFFFRYIKQDPWEPVHERSKSLRWTKEQLEKFDNLVTANSKLHE